MSESPSNRRSFDGVHRALRILYATTTRAQPDSDPSRRPGTDASDQRTCSTREAARGDGSGDATHVAKAGRTRIVLVKSWTDQQGEIAAALSKPDAIMRLAEDGHATGS